MAAPLIFDGDYPMAYGAFELGRDLTRPLAELRASEADAANQALATLPEMRRGRIAVALVKVVGRQARPGSPLPGYASAEAAAAAALGQLAYYRLLARRREVELLTDAAALTDHLVRWDRAEATDRLPIGLVLGMEGADPILDSDHLVEWWQQGLRVISLTHYGVSRYAHGTGTPGGLLPAARPLLEAISRLGLILDVTHLAEAAFWEALALFDGPLLASHQNCRALVPGERQFSDEQLRALIARGAVIGVAMDTWMLYPGLAADWATIGGRDRRTVFPRSAVTLEQVADHIDHLCQLAGTTDHAALGGDTDGQGGVAGAPADVDSVADYQRLEPLLARRGYTASAVAAILHGNWQRFYTRWLPDGRSAAR